MARSLKLPRIRELRSKIDNEFNGHNKHIARVALYNLLHDFLTILHEHDVRIDELERKRRELEGKVQELKGKLQVYGQ